MRYYFLKEVKATINFICRDMYLYKWYTYYLGWVIYYGLNIYYLNLSRVKLQFLWHIINTNFFTFYCLKLNQIKLHFFKIIITYIRFEKYILLYIIIYIISVE